MKRLAMGAALLCSMASALIAQQATDSNTPPPRDLIKNRPLKTDRPRWNAQQRDGAFLEEIVYVTPTQIYPDEGIGLPPGTVDQDEFECEAPAPGGPVFGPLFRLPPDHVEPASQDLSGSAPFLSLMQGWEGIGPNGLDPPDPDAAAGYDYVVTVTNDDFAVYDRCDNELFRADIETYLGTDPRFLMFDPKVIFDPWDGRWVMMYHKWDNSNEEASLAIVITTGSIPFGLAGSGAYWYDFDAVQGGGTSFAAWPDYFDLGYSNDFVTVGGNMFLFSGGFRWARIWILDKAEIYNALPAGSVRWSNLTNADGSTTDTPRAVKMQYAWTESGQNIDGSWINSRGGGGTKLTHWKVQDAFGVNTLYRSDITTAAYVHPPNAVQPTGELLHTIDARLMPAVTTGDLLGANGVELFTSLTTEISGVSGTRLFKVDPVNNTLKWEQTFWGGTSWYYWYACPAADYSGSNYWVFARTGPNSGSEPEIRYVDMNKGTFSNSSSAMRDGDGSYNGFRWGDYFGGQLDWGDYSANFSLPGRPSKVWLYGEFGKNDSWGTYVGATSVWSQGVLSSVTPTGTYTATGLQGGPFTPGSQVYTLTNNGEVGLAFEVLSLPPWLDTSVTNGQLFPGTTTVTISVNSSANSLAPGVYTDSITFRDCFNGGNSFNRNVRLVVQTVATATFRNDAGNTNPTGYFATPPVLNTTWSASVNNNLTGNTLADIVGYATPWSSYLGSVGDYILVNIGDPNGELMQIATKFGSGVVSFTAPIPNDLTLMGFTLATQGYGFGGGGPRLQNAYDLKVGI